MNKNDDSFLDENENDLKETMSLMSRLEPTLAARVKNRQVIAAELAQIEQRRIHPPSKLWWRQSITLPVPIAMGFCTLLVASALTWLPIWGNTHDDSTASLNPAEPSYETDDVATSSDMSAPDKQQPLNYYATETYLCGIGRIIHKSVHQYQEQ